MVKKQCVFGYAGYLGIQHSNTAMASFGILPDGLVLERS